jgi:tetratricopeptide (TPR) repeat protein
MLRFLWARVNYMWGSLHRHFGNQSSLLREHRHAVRRFSRAIELDPGYREARLSRGVLFYREMGRPEEAMADFNALLADDPDYGPALLNRAMLAQEHGRYGAALLDLEHYLRLPGEDEGYRRIALRTADLLREVIAEVDAAAAPPDTP